MLILGIETSCDETAAAVVADGRDILSQVVASQVEIHARFGGIVPEIASRQQLLEIVPVVRQALGQAGVAHQQLSAVAVTLGPGLAGSLLVGASMAKALALAWDLPLVGVNHLEAHIYANWLAPAPIPSFPCLALLVSGGHTLLIFMEGHGRYRTLGQTRDDAAGEAFDKVARLLGLGYPGGPAIEKAAEAGQPRYHLPRAWLRGSHDFSFSGLKTATLHLAMQEGLLPPKVGDPRIADLATSFQEAAVEVLAEKTARAALGQRARQVLLAGGVAANKALRQTLGQRCPLPLQAPPPQLCADNGAMVAACAFYLFQSNKAPDPNLDVQPNLRLG
ncbi:MAG: tRNA (adenosine(37)-N6)-threonylcarbamoyltransferase complex transferase subunit TsaD [Chloroflexi bacterium]|nr:tRNA (adenosine(37)-N6)-threonylcarbamoyltransferase complex transferase subunit TsaD [Chloroflexota bacterium]